LFIVFGFYKFGKLKTDLTKHKTILIWFLLALFIIVLNIPWPFSPLVSRPYLRPF